MADKKAAPEGNGSEAEETATGSAHPETVTVSGAGTAEANGVYVYRPDGETKRVFFGIRCVRGIYEHTTNNACWLGFHDCAAFGRPEWNKWMLYNASGILYAAHTGGQLGVPPRKGRWEIASLGKKQNVGAYPPPLVGHGGTVFEDLGDVISDKDVGLVTTTDASRVGSFKLVLATEPSRALAKNHQYDIDDRWNMYGASTKLTDLRAAATFCFAADHEHVSLEADRYLGLAVNCAQYVEGGSCCLLRSKNQPEGGSGGAWKINSDGTLSPKENKDLVLGFGPITYDSWNRREQTADSIGGAEFVAVGLVAPTSAQRLIVSSTATAAVSSTTTTAVHSTATTAPDDEMATTPPSDMSMERGPEKPPPHVISSKSLHGCSCDGSMLFFNWILSSPGFSCISPHPSAPDSEDVFARWAYHGIPPLCCLVTNERWERVERSNTFRRKEGGQVPRICEGAASRDAEAEHPDRTHCVTRCCGCCLCHQYHPLPTGIECGLQPTSFHGILCCYSEGVKDYSPKGPGGGSHNPHHMGYSPEPHNHMGYSMHNPAPTNQQNWGTY